MPDFLPNWDTDEVESLRRFASVRLIAIDVDGTLVQSFESAVYHTILNLRATLERQGVHVTIATGRTLQGVRRLLGPWKSRRATPLILYNGSVVLSLSPFHVLRNVRIDPRSLAFVLDVCSTRPVRVLSYTFSADGSPLFDRITELERVYGWSYGECTSHEINGMAITWVSDWATELLSPANAILVDISRDPEVSSDLIESLQECGDISITRSGASYLEIRPVDSSKAAALAVVSSYLGIDRSESLSLGDNDNDVEMLRWTGTGIAVAGASAAALAASDYICRHGAAEAAVEALRLVKHSRRFFS